LYKLDKLSSLEDQAKSDQFDRLTVLANPNINPNLNTTYDLDCQSQAEADLGMFSMFGRTGAPQKEGPTIGQKHFWPQTASQLLLQ